MSPVKIGDFSRRFSTFISGKENDQNPPRQFIPLLGKKVYFFASLKVFPSVVIIQMKSCIGKVSLRKTIVWWTGYSKLTRLPPPPRSETFPTPILFTVAGENCGAEAGDNVLAASILVIECEVPSLLPGKRQHLLRGVREEVRLEKAEEEEAG